MRCQRGANKSFLATRRLPLWKSYRQPRYRPELKACLGRVESLPLRPDGNSVVGLRTVSCLIEGCFLVGFARGFGYVMRLRCAIVLNSRDGFEETCPSIFRFTRKLGSRTKSSTENFKISSNALNFRASSWRQVSYGLASEDKYE